MGMGLGMPGMMLSMTQVTTAVKTGEDGKDEDAQLLFEHQTSMQEAEAEFSGNAML